MNLRIEHGVLCLVGGGTLAGLALNQSSRMIAEHSVLGMVIILLMAGLSGVLFFFFATSAEHWMRTEKKDCNDLVVKIVFTISRGILGTLGAVLMYFMGIFLGALFGGCAGMFVSAYKTGDPYTGALPYTMGGIAVGVVLVTAKLINDNLSERPNTNTNLDDHVEL